ncbi:MAG: hypothetical protein ACRYG4_01405 [Janthinobacterium lividum]
MLGIELEAHDDARLDRMAENAGRSKSAVARDWILARMEREDVDAKIRNFASLDVEERLDIARIAGGDATNAWLRALDAEDAATTGVLTGRSPTITRCNFMPNGAQRFWAGQRTRSIP